MEHMEYRIAFFKAGLTAMIKMWLNGGCKENPEDMTRILEAEFAGRGTP